MPKIAFIGAGNMAEAIARGLLRTAAYQPSELCASDPNPERQKLFAEELGIPCAGKDAAGMAAAETVILAVKPFVMGDALEQIANKVRKDALIISIAAGISTGFIEGKLGGTPRVIRVMPNTPMLVGKGVSALCRGKYATEEDAIAADRIFAAGGATVRVTENLMDAVTAVSGSGPAYVFYLAEVLASAGVAAGLTAEQAGQLARQTVIGAGELLAQSKDSAAELRKKVTTPNGTTQAAIETMQAGDLAGLVTKAVAAAAKRSAELGK